jgi:TolA-binding protein
MRKGKSEMIRWLMVAGILLVVPVTAMAQEVPFEQFQAAVAQFQEGKLQEGKLQEANDAFAALLTLYDTPQNRATIEFDAILAGSRYHLGEIAFAAERYEEAMGHYQAVIGSYTTWQAESRYHLGLAQYYRQDYAAAVATLDALVAAAPGSPLAPQALYYQGICYELAGDPVNAVASFKRLIENYPLNPWTKTARGKVGEAP